MDNLSISVCWNPSHNDIEVCGLFDNEEKKPIQGSCGHLACAMCVKTNPSLKCPICKKENAFIKGRVDYNVLEQVEKQNEHPMDYIEKWWKQKPSSPREGYCFHCKKASKTLHLCFNCNGPAIEYPDMEDESNTYEVYKRGSLSIKNFPSMFQCADCLFATNNCHRSAHKVINWSQVDNMEIHLKKAAFPLAKLFLMSQLEKSEGVFKCELRKVAIQKKFEGLFVEIWNYLEKFPGRTIAEIDHLLFDLKKAWQEFKYGGNNDVVVIEGPKCECTQLWEEMTQLGRKKEVMLGFENIIAISSVGLDECPSTLTASKMETDYLKLAMCYFKGEPARNPSANVGQRERNVQQREANVLERETNVTIREENVTIREENVTRRESAI